ncbi:MAG: hypothetical protein BGO01_03665 [Armatimonadetes bacterium 55-13]|nr:hypothetical protein [Armatimonadota bacterium]OJU63045.1 MAG: hypothetical protein BGO01_03665 [Armatimonadetes bacterium 55-13]
MLDACLDVIDKVTENISTTFGDLNDIVIGGMRDDVAAPYAVVIVGYSDIAENALGGVYECTMNVAVTVVRKIAEDTTPELQKLTDAKALIATVMSEARPYADAASMVVVTNIDLSESDEPQQDSYEFTVELQFWVLGKLVEV